jgi:hypothetical protein
MSNAQIKPSQVIYGVPFEEYRAMCGINCSALKLIERSPAHYIQSLISPHAPTTAQALGTLTHLLVLEWERAHEGFIVAPECDRRTKDGKAIWADFQAASAGKLVVTQEQYDDARAMRDAILGNDYARALLADGDPEVTLFGELGGINAQARLDWLCNGHDVIVDLKTATDASEKEFGRAAGKYGYHMQAAFYTDLAAECGLGARDFVFIVVENTAPYAVALYQLEPDAVHIGRIRYQRALQTYVECLEADQWHGYAPEIQPLAIPHWAL